MASSTAEHSHRSKISGPENPASAHKVIDTASQAFLNLNSSIVVSATLHRMGQ